LNGDWNAADVPTFVVTEAVLFAGFESGVDDEAFATSVIVPATFARALTETEVESWLFSRPRSQVTVPVPLHLIFFVPALTSVMPVGTTLPRLTAVAAAEPLFRTVTL